MRHLKKFEELNLDTYINAGEMLKKSGHADRGQKLIDWAKRGQLDDTPDVNIWIKWMTSYPAQRASAIPIRRQTERKEILKGLISDVPIKAKVQMVHVNLDILKDDIDYHKEQNGYPIIIGTVFIIDQSELEKIKPEYLNLFKGEAELSGTSYKIWSMELSSSFKLDENGNISQVFPVTTFTYGEMGSIFSDRRSANNFKNILRRILSNEIKIYTRYKDEDDGQFMTNSEAMFQILTKEIPTIEISDIEMIIDTFKNINTNTLYSENSLEASKRIYQ